MPPRDLWVQQLMHLRPTASSYRQTAADRVVMLLHRCAVAWSSSCIFAIASVASCALRTPG